MWVSTYLKLKNKLVHFEETNLRSILLTFSKVIWLIFGSLFDTTIEIFIKFRYFSNDIRRSMINIDIDTVNIYAIFDQIHNIPALVGE